MAQFKQWFDQDFNEKIEIHHCESVMFTGDDQGALVGVRLFDNGVAYSGGGTVTGAVKRSDGGRVALTGTLSGNAASVVIPAAALAYSGPIGVQIILTVGSEKTTVLKAIYGVDDTSGTPVDPGELVPDIDDLLAEIENMRQATAAANTAAASADTARESMQSAVYIQYHKYLITKDMLTAGAYSSGGYDVIPAANSVRTSAPIFLPKGGHVWITNTSNATRLFVGRFDVTGKYIGEASLTPGETNTYFSTQDQYVILQFRGIATVNDYAGEAYVSTPIYPQPIETPFFVNGSSGGSGGSYYFTSSSTRLRLINQVHISVGDKVQFTAGTTINQIYCEVITDDTFTTTSANSGWLNDGSVYVSPISGLMTLIFRNSGNTEVTPSDFDAEITITPANVETISVGLEYGYYRSGGNRTYGCALDAFYRSKINALYLDTGVAKSAILPKKYASAPNTYVLTFDADQHFIQSVIFNGSAISLPSNCKYIGLYTDNVAYTSIDVTLYGCAEKPKLVKRFQRSLGTFPTVESDALGYVIRDNNFSIMRLLLPSNYTLDGPPVPAIIWLRGSSGSSEWMEDFGRSYTNTNFKNYIAYLRDEGFAVCAMHTWGSYYNNKYGLGVENASPYPAPTCIDAIQRGIEHLCSRYNVDGNNIHMLGHSQGGQIETYCVTNPIIPLRSISMFAPVCDYMSMPGESLYVYTRQAIAEDLALTGNTAYFTGTSYNTYSEDGIAFWRGNIEKLALLNEAWTSLIGGTLEQKFDTAVANGSTFWAGGTAHPDANVYNDTDKTKIGYVPVKIWASADDSSTPFKKMTELIYQLQNGGCEAVMRILPNGTGGHASPLYGSQMSDPVTTETGVVYSNLPVAWYEAVQFMRTHMAKT